MEKGWIVYTDIQYILCFGHQANLVVYSALECLSVGCWCFSAYKTTTTPATTHSVSSYSSTTVNHFPPVRLCLSSVFLPSLHSLILFLSYSSSSPFTHSLSISSSVSSIDGSKVQVLSPQNAKWCLSGPTTELRETQINTLSLVLTFTEHACHEFKSQMTRPCSLSA